MTAMINAARRRTLAALTGQPLAAAVVTVHLFTSRADAKPDMVPGDFVEAAYEGYAAATVEPDEWRLKTDEAGVVVGIGTRRDVTFSGPSRPRPDVVVRGWFLVVGGEVLSWGDITPPWTMAEVGLGGALSTAFTLPAG